MEAWGRRRFVKALGGSVFATLVLEHPSLPVTAAQLCAYGGGTYGAGLYSGTFSTALPTIRVERSATDVVLSWSPGPAGVRYEVWRSQQPFTLGDPGSILIGVTSGVGLVDPGALGSPNDSYYVVRGEVGCE